MPEVRRVLVVEDDDAIRSLLATALHRNGLEVDTADDGGMALRLAEVEDYAVIVLDLMMPRVSGFSFLEGFRRMHPRAATVIIVLTAFDDAMIRKLPADQVHAIVRKPFDVPQLAAVIHEIVSTSRKVAQDEVRQSDGESESLPAC